MAWKNRFQGFRARASGFRKRYGGRAKGIMGASVPYVIGFALGMTNFDKHIPAEIKLGVACAPSGLMRGGLGSVQKVAQGMVLGDLVQARTGLSLGGGSGNGSSSGGV